MNPALKGYHDEFNRYVMGVNLPQHLFWRRYDEQHNLRESKVLALFNVKATIFEPVNNYNPESIRILLRRLNHAPVGYRLCYNCCGLGHWLSIDSEYLLRVCPTCEARGLTQKMQIQENLL